jgi:hypothetical protein
VDWRNPKPVKRGVVICAVVFACAVAPGYAADPLVSGYSGPGGGEQVVIGSSVLPPKHGNGSIRSSAGTQSAAPQPATQGTGGSQGSSGDSGAGKSAPAQQQPSSPETRTPIVAAKPTYPNTVSSASGLPLSGGDLLLVAGAGLIAALVAFAAMRLRRNGA